MTDPRVMDGLLVEWGERLFYPGNRRVTAASQARLRLPLGERAAAIRQKIRSTLRRSPQVMVKVTGGGRGMGPSLRTSATSARAVGCRWKMTAASRAKAAKRWPRSPSSGATPAR